MSRPDTEKQNTMSFVAISFPVQTGPITQRKNESLRRAKKFASELKITNEAELVAIKEGVYGYIMSEDVDVAVLKAAGKHGGKVLPITESEVAPVEEGKWITLESAALGVRFDMRGTTASNPVEGKILPGKYFVLGLKESNGGQFATLGRVDRLADIGRPNGPGRYAYNVDLNVLRESLAKQAVADQKAKEDKKDDTQKTEAHDRSNEILDLLLENDPYVLADNRRKALKESQKATNENVQQDEEFSLENLVDYSVSQEAKDLATAPSIDGDSPAEDSGVLVESEEGTDVAPATETDDLEEGFDPELFAECRDVVAALTERGVDVYALSEEELIEATEKLYAELEEAADQEDSEDSSEAEEVTTEDSEAVEDDKEAANESEADDAFEAAEADSEESK